jgi:hypothetical protein
MASQSIYANVAIKASLIDEVAGFLVCASSDCAVPACWVYSCCCGGPSPRYSRLYHGTSQCNAGAKFYDVSVQMVPVDARLWYGSSPSGRNMCKYYLRLSTGNQSLSNAEWYRVMTRNQPCFLHQCQTDRGCRMYSIQVATRYW